ncbi:MAG: hypothetical protein R2719_15585 [Micropruina sp.]
MTEPTESTETTEHHKTPVKATIASWVGTTLEYYDFAVYARRRRWSSTSSSSHRSCRRASG